MDKWNTYFIQWILCLHAKLLQSHLTLCNLIDYTPPASSVHGILQARTLEWVAMPSSRGSSPSRDWTQVSYSLLHCQVFFITRATWEAPQWILLRVNKEGDSDPCCKTLKTFSSVQFSCSVMSDSLWPHEWQHVRPPCPSQLPEFTQTHVHRVGDAIQPSHPLSSPTPTAPNPSQHQSLFQWVNSSHEVAKVLELY